MRWTKALGCAALALLAMGFPARAQVVRDGSLGVGIIGSGFDSDGGFADYVINEYHGALKGGNLFHSFSDFSIGGGEIAAFTLTDSIAIDNIVARVTGGDISDIRGTIRTTSDLTGAALFLLNPAGISFGENAYLDVQGSFHASTADVLRFEEGPDFDALDTTPHPLLSAAEPSAFGFTRPDPGLIAISRSRDLGVPPGETFSLIGGFDSQFPNLGGVQIISAAGFGENILAPEATVQIAAARPGIDIPLDLSDPELLNVDKLEPGDLGNVVLQNFAQVDVSTPFGDTETRAGEVVIRAEQFVMANSAFVNARNGCAEGALGPVDIAATGGIEIGTGSQITTWSQGAGKSSDVVLRAEKLSVSGEGELSSYATGAGEAGALRIYADDVDIGYVDPASGEWSGGILQSMSFGSGPGGAIAIDAGSVDLTGGGRVTSKAFSDGSGGAIDVHAQDLRISNAVNDPEGTLISSNTLSLLDTAGDGGALEVDVGTLRLEDGGQLFARTAGAGNAGPLTVDASGSMVLSGVDGSGFPSGITSRALQSATGEGGLIEITTPILEMGNGAQIASDTFGAGAAGALGIFASERVAVEGGENGVSIISAGSFAQSGSPPDLGPGGTLRIETGSLELRNGGQVSVSTSGPNEAGAVIIEAAQVEISGAADPSGFNASGVFSQSLTFGVPDGGDGGDISITAAGDVAVWDGARISARSDGTGNAGDIFVETGGSLELTSGSTMTAETSGSGHGGSIDIDATSVELVDGGEVTASTTDTGDSGSIVIEAQRVLIQGENSQEEPSGVFAQTRSGSLSDAGNAGSIDITARESLKVVDSGQIAAASMGGGFAGDVAIRGGGSVEVARGGLISALAEGPIREASPETASDIVIAGAAQLTVASGGTITAETRANAFGGTIDIDVADVQMTGGTMTTETRGSGVGGTIDIDATSVELVDSTMTAQTEATGAGGDISITAAGDVAVWDGARISARSDGPGNAGDIFVETGGSLELKSGGQITTEADSASGGRVTIKAQDLAYLLDSSITTSVALGEGGGGDIVIDPPLVVLNRSELRADAFEGPGGNISIVADAFLMSGDSVLSASSELGIDGVIEITAADSDLVGKLATLPATFLDAPALLQSACAARTERAGSFVVERRAEVVAPPDAPLTPLDVDGSADPQACRTQEETR